MNFGEKLTNLRKQKGLSQEELGYELNVTRQTVSKWELGQTTPEMDKLVEISKIFGVTVDELTSNENIVSKEVERIEDKAINDKPQENSTLKIILLIVAISIIVVAIIYGIIYSKIFNFGKDALNESKKLQEQLIEGMENIIDKNIENSNQVIDKVEDFMEDHTSSNEPVKEQSEQSVQEKNEQSESTIDQQQMLEQYKKQEQLVNEQMEKMKEQMSPEQREWFEQAQKQQQQLLQQYK